MQSSAIPKFGSFKSKPTSASASAAASEDEHKRLSTTQARTPSHSLWHRRPGSRDRDHHQYRHHGRGRPDDGHTAGTKSSHRHRSTAEPDSTLLPAETYATNDLYLVDRRGDRDSVKYGSNSKSSVPLYNSPNERKILAAPVGFSKHAPSLRSLLSTLSKDERSILRDEPNIITTYIPQEQEAAQDGVAVEYLALDSRRKRRRLSDQQGLQPSGQDANTVSSDDASDTAPDEDQSSGNAKVQQASSSVQIENARLSQMIKAEPKNVQAWRDLIEFQQVVQSTLERGSTSSSQKQSLSALRLSLYQEATVKLGTDHPQRDSFLLSILDEGSKVWEDSKLRSKWKETAEQHASSPIIQLGYVNFLQIAPNFLFDDCRTVYCKYLGLLQTHSFAGDEERLAHQLHAVLRFTLMARDAGFRELARGIWQGLIHLHVLIPETTDPDQWQTLLEKFWDSEVSRVGDTDHHESQAPIDDAADVISSTTLVSGARAWAKEEAARATTISVRGADDNEDDPYRTVLFDDIKPFMIKIPTDASGLLLSVLLRFHGMPMPTSARETMRRPYCDDPFIFYDKAPEQSDEMNGAMTLSNIISQPCTLFANHATHGDALEVRFVRTVLQTLVDVDHSDSHRIAESLIALTLRHSPSESRKVAKILLKKNPLSLRLYNAFSYVENAMSGVPAADRILNSTLTMSASLGSDQRWDEILLRQTLVWFAIQEHDRVMALKHVHAFTEQTPAYEVLIRRRDEFIKNTNVDHAVICSELLAIESYLVNDFDVASAIDTFRDESAVFAIIGADAAFATELLYQAQAHLIDFHISRFKSYSPALLRPALRASVLAFPSNSMFLQQFTANESRFLIDSRMRSTMADSILCDINPSVISWLAYLNAEINNAGGRGATQHSIRAAFERAVASKHGEHSEAIWTRYLHCELKVAKDLGKAKNVYGRGLSKVTWSKRFLMHAFGGDLASAFTETELRGIYELMLDRGMRLHVEWEA